MGLKTKMQLKFIKTSCRAMPDNKLTELYAVVINQEDKSEKEYPLILEIIKTEMANRGLIP